MEGRNGNGRVFPFHEVTPCATVNMQVNESWHDQVAMLQGKVFSHWNALNASDDAVVHVQPAQNKPVGQKNRTVEIVG